MNTIGKSALVSPQAYFAYNDSIEGRSEYYHGTIVDLPSSSMRHSLIAVSISAEIVSKIRGSGCKPFGMQLLIESQSCFLYPDFSVVCGEVQLSSLNKNAICNPILIVEVLSESTGTRDRGEKFELYKQLESLREYVLVEQNAAQIYVFTKSAAGEWVYNVFTGMEASLRLNSLGIEIPLANIYYDVNFESAATEQES
jgi:Uma2 family endonuclease